MFSGRLRSTGIREEGGTETGGGEDRSSGRGKRRLSFPDLKSSFTAKDRKSPFPDLSREKKIFKDEIMIIEVPIWIFLASCNKRWGQKRLSY